MIEYIIIFPRNVNNKHCGWVARWGHRPRPRGLVVAKKVADFRARYFTPAAEIPLAGHPTIASVYALIDAGRLSISQKITRVSLQLEAGVIEVEVDVTDPARPLITMSQKRPQFLREYEAADVLPAFGLHQSALLPGAPVMTVSTGTPQLMVPLRDLDSLRRVRIDIEAFTALQESGDFFSPHLFVLQGVTEEGATFARHFGLPPDTPEDPFTGSATGGMAAYLWRHGLISSPRFVAEQGHWMGRPGKGMVEVIGPRDGIETVKVGGYAAKVMNGRIILPPEFHAEP